MADATPAALGGYHTAQFTSAAFLDVLRTHDIRISMDGRGCWRDNVFVERLWRSAKYEEVSLRAYETVSDVRTGLRRYVQFFNARRQHTASWEKKLAWYRSNGVHPVNEATGDAPVLVTTSDSAERGLDLVKLNKLISEVCGG